MIRDETRYPDQKDKYNARILELGKRVAKLERSMGKVLPGPWTNFVFGSNWTNYGSGFQTCQWRKVGDVVELRGLATLVTPGTGGTSIITVFPVGARPAMTLLFPTIMGEPNQICRIDVNNSGNLQPTFTVPTWVSLNGIRFAAS